MEEKINYMPISSMTDEELKALYDALDEQSFNYDMESSNIDPSVCILEKEFTNTDPLF